MNLVELVQQDMFMPPEWSREFNHIQIDSRDVQKGDLFIARTASAEAFIADAIERGAVAVLAEGDMGFRCEASAFFPMVPVFFTPAVKQHLSAWLHRRYPLNDLQLVGVTGTNGKSSITQYIAQLMSALGKSCGVVGTLGNGVWPHLADTRNTTPDLSVVLRELANFQQQKVTYAALEVSSHGLQQERVQGVPFAIAVLSNLTQDHLDYHGDMESYFAAKRRLFIESEPHIALINIDDAYGQRLADDAAIKVQVLTYGKHPDADIRYELGALSDAGLSAVVHTPWGVASLQLPLVGEFNLANACAALAVLCVWNFPLVAVAQAASQLEPVNGRMELYSKDHSPLVVVDFAHTPDALTNVLQALKPWQKPITCVFGCGGDRDRQKRSLMMAAALAGANCVLLTDDNPRSEDPEQIFADALADVQPEQVTAMHDRARAIEHAITHSASEAVVVIAGKGHEAYQEIQGVKHPYSDAAVLQQLGYVKVGGPYVG